MEWAVWRSIEGLDISGGNDDGNFSEFQCANAQSNAREVNTEKINFLRVSVSYLGVTC